jgi:4-amino-4-deoxy-L-arabinose transferase-like glycosyltransferase
MCVTSISSTVKKVLLPNEITAAVPDLKSSGPTSSEILHVGLLAVVAIVVLFTDSATKELHGTAVFYASLIRELLESGDPMLIYSDERAYLLKPPLVVWLSALTSKILGLSNFSVTFISRLAGVGVVLLTYALFRRWWSHAVAWLAAFAVLTNSTFVQFTATLRMDSLMMLGLMMSLVGWAYREKPWCWAAIFGGVTVAVLSKGPLGFAAIPLIVAHAALTRQSPFRRQMWWWSVLLLPIALWYASLVNIHGLKPFTELGADAARSTAMPQWDIWQSAYQEYVVKPARRYWPWLPLMLIGTGLALRRLWDTDLCKELRATYLWLFVWLLAVIIGAVLKPDHDIRYLYLGLPVLGLFSALTIGNWTQNRFATWFPLGLLSLTVALIVVPRDPAWRAHDTRATIEQINHSLIPNTVIHAIGGYPVPAGQARRQNTHRDWIHFYTGRTPTVLSWDQTQDNPPAFGNGIFLTLSRGHEARLEQFGLQKIFTTNEMIFALPQ